MIWVLLGIAVVAAVAVWWTVTRPPTPEPGVASFRRHIDALSPEARRRVRDNVHPQRDDSNNAQEEPGN